MIPRSSGLVGPRPSEYPEPMAVPAKKRLTYPEYLALEREHDVRHEFLGGVAWAMAGGSVRHARVKMRLTLHLGGALAGRACEPFDSDLKVRVLETGFATYPDLTVVCGGDERHPEDSHAVTNPTLLAEVLSPSTEAWDRGEKFAQYRRIASLRHYLLVRAEEPHIEHYQRQDDGSWRLSDHRAGDIVVLDALGVSLTVTDLYSGIPTEDESAGE